MKLVKLDRRHKAFKDYGHAYAIRFAEWDMKASKVEKIFTDAYGSQYAWSSGVDSHFRNWRAYFVIRGASFGIRNPQSRIRPYWISFKDESMATLVILKMEMENE